MALTSLGIVEIQINPSLQSQREKAAALFFKSYEIDDTNPLTMKHLADFFFFENDLKLSESLCKRAIFYCERLKRPDTSDIPTFRREVYLLRSDIFFILGKVYHKEEDYESALVNYFKTIEINPQNYAAHFCLAKIHYLNGSLNAVDETLNKILGVPQFKECHEALYLLAKVKEQQGKRFEALALYKKLIEMNPKNHVYCYNIAQMFDQKDQQIALTYYELGTEV